MRRPEEYTVSATLKRDGRIWYASAAIATAALGGLMARGHGRGSGPEIACNNAVRDAQGKLLRKLREGNDAAK